MQPPAYSASDFGIATNIYGGIEHRFIFPRFPIRTQFDSAEEVKNQLREQAIEGGVPELEKLYDFLFTPLKSDVKNLTVRCKVCKSQIRFYSEGSKLLLISVENKHIHKSDRYKDLELKYINAFLASEADSKDKPPYELPDGADRRTDKPVKKADAKPKGSEPKVPEPPKGPPEPTDLMQLLARLNMSALSKVGEDGSRYEVVLGLSPGMKQHMARYGDIVGLELTECLVTDTFQKAEAAPYRLALFTAFDSNCRILLVGFALHSHANVADVFRMLKFFFKMQRKPQGFVTGQEPAVLRTFDILREVEAFRGVHLLDRQRVLEDLELQGELLRLAGRLVEEGNQDRALKHLDLISQSLSEEADATIMSLLEKKEKLCLWGQPPTFVGLSFSSSRQVQSLCKRYFKDRMTIAELLKCVADVDAVLSAESAEGADFFREPTEELFRDARIKEVRQTVEANIFRVFLRQYVRAVKELQMLGKTEDGSTHVQNRFTGATHEISAGKCSCREDVKTGIPCCHLIAALFATPDADYTAHFAERWCRRKDAKVPVRAQPPKFRPRA